MAATAFMGLTLPVVSQTLGPLWATQIDAALTAVDAHDHSPGNGKTIPTSGIGINSDLSFAGFNLTNGRALRLNDQGATLTGAADVGCLYRNGPDLWWNSGGGAAVQITSGGGIAGTPGSISGLASPAALTYSAVNTKFTFTSNTNIDAQLDCGPVTIRTMTASAQGITLQSPSGLAASYALTLFPSLPASTQVVTVTSAGLLGTSTLWAPDGSTIVGSGTLLQAVGVTQNGANASATIKGNRSAADTGIDVVLTSQVTRTAGYLLDVQNLGASKLTVDYLGQIWFSGVPAVVANGSNTSLTILGNRAAADAGTDVVLISRATRTAGKLLDVQNNGTSEFNVDFAGNVTLAGAFVQTNNDAGVTAGTGWSLSNVRLRKVGGFVFFSASATLSSGIGVSICTIPTLYRPAVPIALTFTSSNTATINTAFLNASGAVTLQNTPTTGEQDIVTGFWARDVV